jgi:hypothetical protein
MRIGTTCAIAMLLAGCSGAGGGAAAATQNELAASACEAYAKDQLPDKTYQLDHATLAASMKDAGSRQKLECSVRFIAGKESPDVLKMQFIW